jgi:hypothetical protein
MLVMCAVGLVSIGCSKSSGDEASGAKPQPLGPTSTTAATPETRPSPEQLLEVSTAPEPFPPPLEPTLTRLPIVPTPDLAVVQTETGVEVLDDSGKSIVTLVPHPVRWCRVDPRADVLWFRHADDDGALSYLDLRTTDPATRLLAASPDTIVIDYGDESLGRPESHMFEHGLVVHMQTPPRLEAILGCDGDMVYSCFSNEELEGETEGELEFVAFYAMRLDKHTTALATPPPRAPEPLAALVEPSVAGHAPLPDPERSPTPTMVTSVPTSNCEEMPEECGKARRLVGTPHWLVVVANSRGDFYHETVQLHDPATHEFFDALDPTRRSATPFEAGDEAFAPTWVSPSGTMLADYGRLVKLGSGVVAKDLGGVCGFWGGGWEQ